MSTLQDEANLAALGLVRRAVETSDSDEPGAWPLEGLNDYLARVLDPSFGGEQFNATVAVGELLGSLAQWAGVTYAALIAEREGALPSKARLLAHLDEVEHAALAGSGEDTPL